MTGKNYTGIDVAKYVFALLIPMLHIPFLPEWSLMGYIQQYVSRLGVPFFYSASGFLLYSRISPNKKWGVSKNIWSE